MQNKIEAQMVAIEKQRAIEVAEFRYLDARSALMIIEGFVRGSAPRGSVLYNNASTALPVVQAVVDAALAAVTTACAGLTDAERAQALDQANQNYIARQYS